MTPNEKALLISLAILGASFLTLLHAFVLERQLIKKLLHLRAVYADVLLQVAGCTSYERVQAVLENGAARIDAESDKL